MRRPITARCCLFFVGVSPRVSSQAVDKARAAMKGRPSPSAATSLSLSLSPSASWPCFIIPAGSRASKGAALRGMGLHTGVSSLPPVALGLDAEEEPNTGAENTPVGRTSKPPVRQPAASSDAKASLGSHAFLSSCGALTLRPITLAPPAPAPLAACTSAVPLSVPTAVTEVSAAPACALALIVGASAPPTSPSS